MIVFWGCTLIFIGVLVAGHMIAAAIEGVDCEIRELREVVKKVTVQDRREQKQ